MRWHWLSALTRAVVPHTLLGRTVLIIALALALSQLAAFQAFNLYNRGPRSEQLAQLAAAHLRTIAAALATLSDESRDDFLDALEDSAGIEVITDPNAKLPSQNPAQSNLRLFSSYVREQLGPNTEFFVQRNGRALWVKLPVARETYWVSIPRSQIERRFPWVWLAWVAFSALLALALGYWFVRRINRPLRELAQAAALIGKGETPAPIGAANTSELETVRRAFNDMSRDLETSERERALMLAGISHDLRTPMARLRLGVEMLGDADAQLKQGMHQDIEDMDAIVGQFLDFARDANSETLQGTDLNHIVREMLDAYRRHGKQLDSKLDTLPALMLRPQSIKRALQNLIENAFRYGAEPVAIHTARVPDGAHLQVLDRGPGIPPEAAQRLLQPFTRLDEARGAAPGAGLGLAIVHRIAKQHGARVELLPRDGGGLIVQLTFPLTASD